MRRGAAGDSGPYPGVDVADRNRGGMRPAAAGFSSQNDRVVSTSGAKHLSMRGRFRDAPVGSRGEFEGVVCAMAMDGAETAFTRIPADHPRAFLHMGAAVGTDAPFPKVEKVSYLGRRHDRAPPSRCVCRNAGPFPVMLSGVLSRAALITILVLLFNGLTVPAFP